MSKNVLYLDTDKFDDTIKFGTVLVDFFAEWCGPCKMLAPLIDELADEYAGKVKICKVDTDKNNALASRFNIRGIPTVIIFKDGEIQETLTGFRSKEEYRRILNSFL